MGGNFDYGKKFIQRIDLGAKTKITDIAGRIETFHSDSSNTISSDDAEENFKQLYEKMRHSIYAKFQYDIGA